MKNMSFFQTEDYQELIEDIVRDGRLYASENHQEILKVSMYLGGHGSYPCHRGKFPLPPRCCLSDTEPALGWGQFCIFTGLSFFKKQQQQQQQGMFLVL